MKQTDINKIKENLLLKSDIIYKIDDLAYNNLFTAIADYYNYLQDIPLLKNTCDNLSRFSNKKGSIAESYEKIKYIDKLLNSPQGEVNKSDEAITQGKIDYAMDLLSIKHIMQGKKPQNTASYKNFASDFDVRRLNAYLLNSLNDSEIIDCSLNQQKDMVKLDIGDYSITFSGRRAYIVNFFYEQMQSGNDDYFNYKDFNKYLTLVGKENLNFVNNDTFRRDITTKKSINDLILTQSGGSIKAIISTEEKGKNKSLNYYRWEVKYAKII